MLIIFLSLSLISKIATKAIELARRPAYTNYMLVSECKIMCSVHGTRLRSTKSDLTRIIIATMIVFAAADSWLIFLRNPRHSKNTSLIRAAISACALIFFAAFWISGSSSPPPLINSALELFFDSYQS